MREIEASGCAILACRSCGERMVLLGSTDDWYREGYKGFGCGGCGSEMTLADRVVGIRPETAGMASGLQ